ncbi:cyclin domain-containing protein [Radiomyces spectabilis]|uniref:cyclin domain-containing protein n=1 Tax=Radiomyces spectabilis TaxID=64574 RepID=UPI00221F14DB|nr:cyclin domain-containing protein [Radiomyces spectabilis]KAI8376528.1 cyclin domain-containing protein [Radiomyces spectabilis]
MSISPIISTVCSRSPEALLSFTTNTATTLLPCSKRSKRTVTHKMSAKHLPPLNDFIAAIFRRSQLPPSVCLVSLIYLQRLKSSLPRHARGDIDTPYRLFLAAIMTASKFMSETGSCLTSQVVAEMTDHVYTPKDVNLMERSFLGLIKYDLFVNIEGIKDYLAMHGELLEMDLVEEVLDQQ